MDIRLLDLFYQNASLKIISFKSPYEDHFGRIFKNVLLENLQELIRAFQASNTYKQDEYTVLAPLLLADLD